MFYLQRDLGGPTVFVATRLGGFVALSGHDVRSMVFRVLFFLLLFVFCRPFSGNAVDLGRSVQVHGFVSQGYLDSSSNNFLADSRSGTLEFTDLALNVNWVPMEELRLGSQVFYRNLGNYSEDKVILDWAVADYRPCDELGILLGKVKMPMGFYNEGRDSDFLQPMVLLPQSIYDETRRDIYLAYVGGGLHGNIETGSIGDFDYHFFVGKTDFPDSSVLAESAEQSVQSLIERNSSLPVANRNPDIPLVYHSSKRESDELYGGALVFNSSGSGLRLGASWLHSIMKTYVNHASEAAGVNTIDGEFVFSAEYSLGNWLLAAEYGENDRKSTMYDNVTLDGPSQAWYVMVCYSPFDDWTFSALYDEFYRLKHDKKGAAFPQAPSHAAWRKDFALGLRWDLHPSLTAKAEFHWIDGTAMMLNMYNDEGPERFWNYFAAKLSWTF